MSKTRILSLLLAIFRKIMSSRSMILMKFLMNLIKHMLIIL